MKQKSLIKKIARLSGYQAVGLIIFLFSFQPALYAQNFHLLVFADTDDPGLSAPNLMNISFLTEMSETVCQATGLKNRMAVYKGSDFLATRCDQVLTALRPEPNDVVFFYFMGHGWNNSETEEPMLLFKAAGQNPGPANSRNLKAVFEQLRRKGNRLTLAFGESCNSAINDRSRAKPGSVHVMNVSVNNPEQLKKLFLESRMSILLHTCKRNQKSNSSEDGGWFFTSFMEQFKQVVARPSRQPAQWESLLQASTKATVDFAREQGAVQEPVFHILSAGTASAPTAVKPSRPMPGSVAATTASGTSAAPASDRDNTTGVVDPANASELGNTCAINRTAYNAMRSHLSFLENFRSRVMTMDREAAAEEFRKYYSTDRKEFFHNAPQKLNVVNLVASEVKWFTERSDETAELLDDVAYYVNDAQFKTTAYSQLAIPIDNLRNTVERVKDLIRRCKE
ncbi:caspase family protein [Spirosoma sp.]|uniref:caspase family protein n=1 Tax=Spirosoma sp. TaxID=1899569 RepID=UPI00261056CF|nr:caspase family protein [Spirosoma sp.]MCX6216947.1 caspase family protein [Spirosoma sp.]